MNTPAMSTHVPKSPALSRRAAARRRAAERRRPRLSRLLAWLLSAVLGSAGLAYAQVPAHTLPSGGKVVVGTGQLQQTGNLLVVQQGTAKLGLDWQSFNIGSGATVEFRQPGADSVALNRVLGHSGSQIFGQLRSNGQVFLTNPNGVLFAPGAKVDVGGLVASTLDLSQEDFAAGRYVFGGGKASSGTVANHGSLRASAGGYLALFGQHVSNEGDISVDAGSVVLASGRAATVSISGSGLISAVVTPGAAGTVANSGRIAADGGVVRLTAQSAQDIAASLVNNSGVIRADTLQERNGEIWITGDQATQTGSLSASSSGSGPAGRIAVLGGMQSGSVAVGGTLSATSAGGPGGQVETSAARVAVAADTRVDTRGAGGAHGTWTLDPTDFTVSTGNATATASGIGATTLATNLASTNVTLATAPDGTEAGDIHVNAPVSWSANTTLTLQAARDINLNANLQATGDTAGLVLTPNTLQAGGSHKLADGVTVSLTGANASLRIAGIDYTLVRTLDALQAIGTSGLTGNFALGLSLDASSTATANGGLGFDPIGGPTSNTNTAFRGRFDGLGHTISGLVVNRPTEDLAGLFSHLHNASVSNLRVSGGSVVGEFTVGGLAGDVTGTSRLTNVHSSQAVSATPANVNSSVAVGGLLGAYQVATGGGDITGGQASGSVTTTALNGYVGGLVGYQSAGNIRSAAADVSLSVPGTATGLRIGGLVGQFGGTGGISQATAAGNVPGNNDYAGGLVGYFTGSGGISNASAGGTVSGRNYVGGLAGYLNPGAGTVSAVSASGAVTTTGIDAGGLIGHLVGSGGLSASSATGNVSSASYSIGGLIGYYGGTGDITNVQASGHVSGTDYTGGLVGYKGSGSGDLRNAQATGSVSGRTQVGGLVGIWAGGAMSGNRAEGPVSATGDYAGGLVGVFNGSGNMANSAAIGAVVGSDYVGGLVGSWTSSGSLDTVTANGRVSGVSHIGGLIGSSQSSSGGITTGRATGDVVATGDNVGGLLGYWYTYSSGAVGIVDSQATGTVTGRNGVGGLVGQAYGYYYNTTDAFIDNSSATGQVRGEGSTGGLVGEVNYVRISRSTASGDVRGLNPSYTYVGGLVGQYNGSTGDSITGSSASGNVFVDASSAYVGGLVGYFSSSAGIAGSTASGNVTSIDTVNGNYSSGYVGGLVGYFNGSSITAGSAASGRVDGGYRTGGLVGQYYGTASMQNVSATGAVLGGSNVGGLVGQLAGGGIESGFASGTVTATSASGGVGGLVGWSESSNAMVINDSGASGPVSGGSYAGGLVGYWNTYYYSTGQSGITNSRASGSVRSNSHAGGLVGLFQDSNNSTSSTGIRHSEASGDVTGTTYVGGLVGYGSSYGGLRDSRATGSVTSLAARPDSYLGGLAGYYLAVSDATRDGAITGSYATGSVTLQGTSAMVSTTDVWAGGLVGWLDRSGTQTVALRDSYATGDVTNSSTLGRLRTGGLLGQANASIERTYAAGAVVSTGGNSRAVGGLVGAAVSNSPTATASFWATDGSGQATSALGTATTRAQMLSAATYSGWDIATAGGSTSTWRQYEGQGLPLLRGYLTPVTVALANLNKTYDGGTSLGNAVVTASAGTVSYPERILVSGIDANVGSHTLSAANLHSTHDGYDLTITGSATLTVQPKALTLQGFAASKVYDRSTTATINGSGQPGGLVAGDDLSFLPDANTFSLQFDSKNVGTARTVTLSGSYTWGDGAHGKVSNYTLPTGNTTTADITPATLTAGSFAATPRAYDGTTAVAVSATSATLQGVISGDTVNVDLSTVTSGQMTDRHAGTAKPVAVQGAQITGADAGNYRIAGIDSVTVDITPKVITANGMTINDKTYNNSTAVNWYSTGATLDGVVSGDVVMLRDTYITGQTADKNVGNNLPVTVTNGLALRGPDSPDYTVQAGALAVNVLPRDLYVYSSRTSNTDRTYNGSSAADLSMYTSNAYSSDNLVIAWTDMSFADKNVARDNAGNVIAKTITVSGITVTGTGRSNYTLQNTSTTNSGTIRPVELAVSGVTATNRVYNGSRDVEVNVASATVDTSGVVSGDDVTVAIPTSGTVVGLMANKNAGTNKAVTVPGLTVTGAAAGNYTVNSGTNGVTVDIARKDLTATYVGVDKVYDGGVSARAVASSIDIVAGDSVVFYTNACGGNCGYTRFTGDGAKNVGTDKPVAITYDYFYSGADAGNYNFVNAGQGTTTASISAKPVTLVFSGVNKVYDGTTSATVNLHRGNSGVAGNDVLTVAATAAFSGTGAKNVGNNKPVDVTGISLSGTDAANYTVANTTATTTAHITPKTVTLSGIAGVNRVYDGSTLVAVTANNVTSTGFIEGDFVTVAQPEGGVTSGTVANKNVGTAKPVTVTGLSLQGTDRGNYIIDLAGSGITADITPKPLTASYVGVNRAYNGGVSASVVGSSTDIVTNDTVTFSQSAVFSGAEGRNAGTAKPVAVSGIALGGADAPNYALTATTASTTANITAKTVTPLYAGVDRVYNGLADTSISVIGSSLQLIAGDQVAFTQSAALAGDGSAGQNKAVSVTGITLTGADAANYSLASQSVTTSANITPRPLAIAGITATHRVYDGTSTVNVNVGNAAVDTSNVVAADIGQVAVSLPEGGITTGSMDDRHVGVGKAVHVTGLAVTGTAAANYQVVGAAGLNVNITPLALTATYTGQDKVYDGTAAAQLQSNAAGVLAVDEGTVGLNAPASFAGTDAKNVGVNKPVTVTGAFLTGVNRENYTLLNPNGSTTASITPRDLTVSYTGGTRAYNGGVDAPVTARLANAINGDVLDTTQSAQFTGAGAKNVGSGKAVAVSGITLGGADSGNYRLVNDTASTTASVTPKAITVNGLTGVTATDRVYDGGVSVTVNVPSNVTLSPNSNDIVTSDDVTVAVPEGGITSGTMADKHVGNGKAVTVSGLTLSGGDADNYRIQGTAGITVNISPLALTATYAGVNRVYDGGVNATVTGSSLGILGGDTVSITGSGVFTGSGAKNVGTGKTIDVLTAQLGSTDARNYSLSNPTGSAVADIVAKAVTASYSSPGKVYDGSASAPVRSTTGGFIAGDQVGLDQAATFAAGKNVGADKTIQVSGITLTGADSGNYALTGTTALTAGHITPKPLGINGLQGVTATNRVYDGSMLVDVMVAATGPITPNLADIVDGDVVTVNAPSAGATTGTMLDKNVGTGKAVTVNGLSLDGTDAANYVITATTGVTVDISAKPITAVYTGVGKVYDGSTAATVTGTSTGMVVGDSLSIGGTGVYTGTGARNAGTGKAIDVLSAQLAGADAGNYSLRNPTGTATGDITPKTLTATYTGGTRVYNGSTVAPVTGSTAGLVVGDAVSLAQTAVFSGAGAKNVGSAKPVAVSGITLGGADAGNYALAATTAETTASITPRPLGVDGLTGVTATSRVYDGTRVVEVLVTSTGPIQPSQADVIAGDEVTVTAPAAGQTTGTMANKNVGMGKDVVVAGLTLEGADAGNYQIASTTGVTVNITPRPVSAIYTGMDKVYDGSVAAQATGAASGVIDGDDLSVTASGVFTGIGARNAGVAKSVAVQAASLAGADAGNYSLVNATGSTTASITPRPLTAVFTGGTKVYDGTATAPVVAGSNDAVAGDDLGYAATAQFTGALAKNVGEAKAVAVSGISLTGADAANYSLTATSATTTASVTRRPLNISNLTGVAAVDRVYDGSTAVQVQVVGPISVPTADVISGDVVTVLVPTEGPSGGVMADKHAGTNKAVALNGLTLEGADAVNYQITGTAGVTVNIAPRAVTLVGVTAQDRVYDGSTAVVMNTASGSIAGTLAGDDLQLRTSGVSGAMADKHVGTAKPVAVTGLSLAGADAGNYTVADSALSVNIAARPLVPTLSAVGKVYDGDTGATITLQDNRVAGDALALSATTATFADKNAGVDKAVTASGLSLSGADAANYQLSTTTLATTATIAPAPATVTAASLPKVYGETLSFTGSEFAASGLVAGETIGSVTLASGGAAAAAGVAGSPYDIAASDARGGSFSPGNYLLSYRTGQLTVTPRPLTVASRSLVRYADEANPSSFGYTVNPGGLVNGDAISSLTLAAPADSNNAAGGSVYELTPSAAVFGPGSASNYDLRYLSGLLVVLPTPPRIADADTGGGDTGGGGLGVVADPAEVARATQALERAVAQVNLQAAPDGSPGTLTTLQRPGNSAPPTPADLGLLLGGDNRRITLPELLRLPLLSLDPQLRRLIHGSTGTPAAQSTPAPTP